MKTLTRMTAIVTTTLMLGTSAFALEPIRENKQIYNTLLQGFIGDQIADNCPTIDARTLRALGELNKLKNAALKMGYTSAEVRAFVTNRTEKNRGKADAAAWLKARGAVPGKPDAYCKVGEEEIARNSLIGYLLRSEK